jgi:hypothetical protein
MNLSDIDYKNFICLNSIISEINKLDVYKWRTFDLEKDVDGQYLVPDSHTLIEIFYDRLATLLNMYEDEVLDFVSVNFVDYSTQMSRLLNKMDEIKGEKFEACRLSELQIVWFYFSILVRTLYEICAETTHAISISPCEMFTQNIEAITQETGFLMFQSIEFMKLSEICEAIELRDSGTLH